MENPNSLLVYFNCILPHINRKQEEVLETILILGGATNEEIAEHLGKYPHEISPRTGELKGLNLIITTFNRPNKSGKDAMVWQLNPDYKIQATRYQQGKFGLEKAQEQLPIKKVRYLVRRGEKLVEVN